MSDAVNYSVRDHVAHIEMNRPERHNALDFTLLDGLDEAFARVEEDDEVWVAVLKGAGRSFCSGYDRGGSYYITPPEGGWTSREALLRLRGIEARYRRIWNCPKPTIAQIHGYCLAGGCYLQLVCDISVAAEDAVLGHMSPAEFGPGAAHGVTSMPLWQMILGPKRARYMLMTGRKVDGRQAERIGLVSLAVPADELDAAVAAVVADLTAQGGPAHLTLKEVLNTDLEIQGLGAMFRYHGQMNAMGRLGPRPQPVEK
ncbi:MAG: enoyl-CoA hydratase/isomerase family protein [Thermoanaerobaculia bacterium]|nr:enoyl-CoA hydratase/isomerase family protein [Thermoanaerobaculia bacterium]